jgi:flavin reductase (DIM6/NTAB) family NADH-FMN oxidoreductase RutF
MDAPADLTVALSATSSHGRIRPTRSEEEIDPMPDMTDPHTTIDPAILYFGTPVALISTVDLDGHRNLMPMSSIFWLGHTAIVGMGARSQTSLNLQATRECVINLPSAAQVDAVDRLALTTGRNPVPPRKAAVGYRYEADKFAAAGLTPLPSDTVAAARAAECPVNLEGHVVDQYSLEKDDPAEAGSTLLFEVKVTRVHVHEAIRAQGTTNRIDPDRWKPLIMNFQRFYSIGQEMQPSRLATIDEEWYR